MPKSILAEPEEVLAPGSIHFSDIPVLGSRNWITPAAELESMFFPQPAWILDAIHERLIPLPGYQASTNQTLAEMERRSRLSI